MPSPLEYAKAITAAVIAALTALGAGLADGGMAAQEWVAVALGAAVAFGAVWRVPNTSPERDVNLRAGQ